MFVFFFNLHLSDKCWYKTNISYKISKVLHILKKQICFSIKLEFSFIFLVSIWKKKENPFHSIILLNFSYWKLKETSILLQYFQWHVNFVTILLPIERKWNYQRQVFLEVTSHFHLFGPFSATLDNGKWFKTQNWVTNEFSKRNRQILYNLCILERKYIYNTDIAFYV